ncbi:MAG: hypothetical protein ACI9PX_000275 [Reinekea sp.]
MGAQVKNHLLQSILGNKPTLGLFRYRQDGLSILLANKECRTMFTGRKAEAAILALGISQQGRSEIEVNMRSRVGAFLVHSGYILPTTVLFCDQAAYNSDLEFLKDLL